MQLYEKLLYCYVKRFVQCLFQVGFNLLQFQMVNAYWIAEILDYSVGC